MRFILKILSSVLILCFIVLSCNDSNNGMIIPGLLKKNVEDTASDPGDATTTDMGTTDTEIAEANAVESKPVILLHASQIESAVLIKTQTAIENAGYTVLRFEEPHLFTVSLQECAAFVASAINTVAGLYPGKKIRIVAVCNGGLIAQYVLKNYPAEAALVSHFVSYTSSNQGTLMAPLGVLLNTVPGYAETIGLIAADTITAIDNKYFYPIASDQEYYDGLPGMTKSIAIDRCSCEKSWLSCWTFFNLTLPDLLTKYFLAFGYNTRLIYTKYDEVLRATMLELYVADKFLRFAGKEGGYDIDPTVPIYQQEFPSNPLMVSLRKTPLPAHINATSIFSCMDYSIKPYSNGHLDGATNVVVCPTTPTPPRGEHFDEVISGATFHWSAYYQQFIIDRIIKGLE